MTAHVFVGRLYRQVANPCPETEMVEVLHKFSRASDSGTDGFGGGGDVWTSPFYKVGNVTKFGEHGRGHDVGEDAFPLKLRTARGGCVLRAILMAVGRISHSEVAFGWPSTSARRPGGLR